MTDRTSIALWRMSERGDDMAPPRSDMLLPARVETGPYAEFDHDAATVLGEDDEHRLVRWSLSDGRAIWRSAPAAAQVLAASFSSDDQRIVVTRPELIQCVDARSGAILRERAVPGFIAGHARFAPDGRHVLAADALGKLWMWDVETLELVRRIDSRAGDGQSGSSVEFTPPFDISPDGATVVIGDTSGNAGIWNLTTGAKVSSMSCSGNVVYALAYSPDCTRLACATIDRVVRIFDPRTAEELLQLRDLSRTATVLAWSPDGRRLAAASWSSWSGEDAVVWECDQGAATSLNVDAP